MILIEKVVLYLVVLLYHSGTSLRQISPLCIMKGRTSTIGTGIIKRSIMNPIKDSINSLTEIDMQNIYSSVSLLQECSKNGNPQEAERIFQRMTQNDVDVNKETYELLILSWINSKEMLSIISEEALVLFNQLLKAGYSPSKHITVAVIRLQGQLNRPQEADKLFDYLSFAGSLIEA